MSIVGNIVVMVGNLILGEHYYKGEQEREVALQRATDTLHKIERDYGIGAPYMAEMRTKPENPFGMS